VDTNFFGDFLLNFLILLLIFTKWTQTIYIFKKVYIKKILVIFSSDLVIEIFWRTFFFERVHVSTLYLIAF